MISAYIVVERENNINASHYYANFILKGTYCGRDVPHIPLLGGLVPIQLALEIYKIIKVLSFMKLEPEIFKARCVYVATSVKAEMLTSVTMTHIQNVYSDALALKVDLV